MIATLLAATVALSAPTESQRRLAELRHIYAQSCEVRAYATFDRMCEGLRKQVREAERVERREARSRPRRSETAPAAPVPAAPVPPALALTAPAVGAPIAD